MKRCNNCNREIIGAAYFIAESKITLCKYCYIREVCQCPKCKKFFIRSDIRDILCDSCWTKEHNDDRTIEECLE